MRSKTAPAIAVLAAAALLVVGIDYATLATTGDSLILGKRNDSSHATTIERTDRGPALNLRTRSDADAPLSTNGTGRVRHLNADQVDGRDAKALETRALTYRAGKRNQTVSPAGLWSTPVKPGLYDVSFDAMLWDLNAQGPASFICGVLDLSTFETPNQVIYVAASASQTWQGGGPPAAVSGAATVEVKPGAQVGAVCFPETGSFSFFKPLNVTFTEVDGIKKRVAESAVPVERGSLKRNPFGGIR
jgi:hypothetical protein